jgi:dolichol-phosphate mannosyltransferase
MGPMAQDTLHRPAAKAPHVDAPALVPDVAKGLEPAPELTVILPTFNERANVPVMVERLARALEGIDWEVLIVDDNSPDGTYGNARTIGAQDRRVRCIRRIGRRGLAGACIEGMLASQAQFVAVMDADLQHDETLLAAMVQKLRAGDTDLVAASRYIDGTTGTGFSAGRAKASQWSTALARRLLKVDLTDPMSGFFMLRRAVIDDLAPKLSTQGFKILLDIAATGRDKLRVAELPYVFGARQHGESKLDARVALDFGQLLLAKLTNDAVSYRFVLFCLVGATGIGAHMAALYALHALGVSSFGVQQTIATMIAIAWNYVFNNAYTYRDQRLTGWAFARGLIEFELICSVGAISNIGVASLLYAGSPSWWIAGLGGAVMGAVWNYAVSAAVVWKAQ